MGRIGTGDRRLPNPGIAPLGSSLARGAGSVESRLTWQAGRNGSVESTRWDYRLHSSPSIYWSGMSEASHVRPADPRAWIANLPRVVARQASVLRRLFDAVEDD